MKALDFKGNNYLNLRTNTTITIQQLIDDLIEFRKSNKELFFNTEYMKYELFIISEFDLSIPRSLGWKWDVCKISDGLTK